MTEIWRDIKGYEGMYQVSNTGKIRSLDRTVTDRNGITYKKQGREIRQFPDNYGYKRCKIYKDGKRKTCKVHREVAKAFLPNPDNLPQVNHKDEDIANNTVDNLEWCTAEYNYFYGTRIERIAQHHRKAVKCINTGEIFNSVKDAAKNYNILAANNISQCCIGNRSVAGTHPVTGEKLKWEYVERE